MRSPLDNAPRSLEGVWQRRGPGSALCSDARTLLALVLAVVVVGSSGCSYRLAGDWGEEAATVSIVTLENDSVEAGVERTVSRALRKEFQRRGGPRVVADPRAADVVIRGTVLPLQVRSNTFSTVALTVEYEVRLTLSLQVHDREGARIPLGRFALSESEFYLASADAEAARKNRQEALRRIADVLAGRIHDAIGLHFARLGEGADASGEATS